MSTRRMRRSAAINSPASGGKRTRWRWMPISKPKTCW
uniref:Uncharacterized protein n=1 Tax=Klebsiella pneumoniae TaxID=573 RepID=Q1G0V3_KLEPN|nr:unknown [Klebsiella pneumoniae]